MSLYNLSIGSVYNINMLAPSILGTSYTNAKVLGMLDFESANIITDVTPIHLSVHSSLPNGTPKSASDLIYIKIRTSTGEVRVIAQDWINGQPTLVSNKDINIVIKNTDISKIPLLRNLLQSNGFTNVSISTS